MGHSQRESNDPDTIPALGAEQIWNRYQRCLHRHQQAGLAASTAEAWRFFLGDQWQGDAANSGDTRYPMLNFIKGVVRYKTAVIARHSLEATFSPHEPDPAAEQKCQTYGRRFRRCWDLGKMDTVMWRVVRDACVAGDSYLYFPGKDTRRPQIVENINVFLADEQCDDLQSQAYIILRERRTVQEIAAEARRNGLSRREIDLIVPDREDSRAGGTKPDPLRPDNRCVSLLYLYRDKEGYVHTVRSVRQVIYQPDRALRAAYWDGSPHPAGVRKYPLAAFVWEREPGSARGRGDVRCMIPNQMEVNKTLARRSAAIQMNAFARLVYDENAVINPDALGTVGAPIAMNADVRNIQAMIAYLEPGQMSGDAEALTKELIDSTRRLEGAGDEVTGQIDPTRASGAAILAARDQAMIPLNEQIAAYRQLVEDVALIWLDLWSAYDLPPENFTPGTSFGRNIAPAQSAEGDAVHIRIDISEVSRTTRLGQVQALQRLLEAGYIDFEEFVDALEDDTFLPKSRLERILKSRKALQEEEASPEISPISEEILPPTNRKTPLGRDLYPPGMGFVPPRSERR